MLSGKLDFSIMHYETPDPAIQYEALADDPFYLVMPASFAQKYQFPDYRELSIYDLKSLSEEPFLMIASRQKLRQVIDAILSQLNIHPNVRFTTKNMETAKRLAAAGMGITFLPLSYLTLFSGIDNLACYPLDQNLQASWKLVIGYPKNRPLSRCSKEFIRILKGKDADRAGIISAVCIFFIADPNVMRRKVLKSHLQFLNKSHLLQWLLIPPAFW